MSKIYWLFIGIFLFGCEESDTASKFVDLERFLVSLETDLIQCHDINWKEKDDTLNTYIKEINQAEIADEESKKLDEITERYLEIKKGDSIKPILNFYLDNSISMQGYFKGKGFRPVLAQLLLIDKSTKYNLHYANEEVVFQSNDPISFFDDCENLDRHINARNSDMNAIFNSILSSVSTETVGVFISDGIYSMGDASKSVEALDIKKRRTTLEFEERLSHQPDIQTVVYKMQSDFDGIYYDEFDESINFTGERPFYIWFFGNELNLSKVLCQLKLDENNAFREKAKYKVITKRKCPYSITKYGEVGYFRNKFGDLLWHEIIDVETSSDSKNSGKFAFSIAIDFRTIICESEYLLNPENYSISGGSFKIDSIIKTNENLLTYESSLNEFRYRQSKIDFNPTHFIFISTDQLKKSKVKITLNDIQHHWVINSSTLDSQPGNQKTFGFKHLMEGIEDAYKSQNENNFFTSFQVELK